MIEVSSLQKLRKEYERTRNPNEAWSLVYMYAPWHWAHHAGLNEQQYDAVVGAGKNILKPFKGCFLKPGAISLHQALILGTSEAVRQKLLKNIAEQATKIPGANLWRVMVAEVTDDSYGKVAREKWLEAYNKWWRSETPIDYDQEPDLGTGALEETLDEFWERIKRNALPNDVWSMVNMIAPHEWMQGLSLREQQKEAVIIVGRDILKTFPKGYFVRSMWSCYLGIFPGTPDNVRFHILKGIVDHAASIEGADLWRVFVIEIKDGSMKEILDKAQNGIKRWMGTKTPTLQSLPMH